MKGIYFLILFILLTFYMIFIALKVRKFNSFSSEKEFQFLNKTRITFPYVHLLGVILMTFLFNVYFREVTFIGGFVVAFISMFPLMAFKNYRSLNRQIKRNKIQLDLHFFNMIVSNYIITGFFFYLIYWNMVLFNTEHFEGFKEASDLLYYSFVTLTTLGYGDIRPVSDLARFLSVIESIVGVIFIAFFIGIIIKGKGKDKVKPFKPKRDSRSFRRWQ